MFEEVQIGRHTLYRGDCLEVLKEMPSHSVDVVVTSPPYNLHIPYEGYVDDLTETEYGEMLARIFTELARVVRDDASVFINLAGSGKHPWLPLTIPVLIGKLHQDDHPLWRLQNDIVWVKSIAVDDVTYGHMKPVNSRRFLNNTHERILHFTRTGATPLDRLAIGVPYMHKGNIARFGETGRPDKRCRGNTWFIPYETIQSKEQRGDHPAIFPVGLPMMAIELHGKPGAVVLDLFSGTATTVAAAQMLSRLGAIGVGIEISQVYHDVAVARISAHLAREARLQCPSQ